MLVKATVNRLFTSGNLSGMKDTFELIGDSTKWSTGSKYAVERSMFVPSGYESTIIKTEPIL